MGHAGVCCFCLITLQSRSSFLYVSPLTWVTELGLIPGNSSGFSMLVISMLRQPPGTSQCVLCICMCFVHWRWRICIITRASSKTQTSPGKTVSSSLKFSSSFTQSTQEFTNSSHLKFGQWSWGLLVNILCWKCHYKLKTDDTTQTPPCVSHLASCHSIAITIDGPAPSQSCQKKCQTWPCGGGGSGGGGGCWRTGGEGGASLPQGQGIKWMTSSFQQE